MWGEITYSSQTVKIGEWISNSIHILLNVWLLIHADIKLIHVGEGGLWLYVVWKRFCIVAVGKAIR